MHQSQTRSRCGLNVMRWKPARMKIAAPQAKEAEVWDRETWLSPRTSAGNVKQGAKRSPEPQRRGRSDCESSSVRGEVPLRSDDPSPSVRKRMALRDHINASSFRRLQEQTAQGALRHTQRFLIEKLQLEARPALLSSPGAARSGSTPRV